jgi:hypothetical protein
MESAKNRVAIDQAISSAEECESEAEGKLKVISVFLERFLFCFHCVWY